MRLSRGVGHGNLRPADLFMLRTRMNWHQERQRLLAEMSRMRHAAVPARDLAPLDSAARCSRRADSSSSR